MPLWFMLFNRIYVVLSVKCLCILCVGCSTFCQQLFTFEINIRYSSEMVA